MTSSATASSNVLLPSTAWLGRAALAGVLVFGTVCVAAQFLRADLDWTRAPLSFYLVGAGGTAVKSAYAVLSVAIAAIGIGCYRALGNGGRSAAPLLLFVLAAIALDAVALFDTATRPGEASVHAFLHNFAALTTFLSITVAMLLQSWRFRSDTAWRVYHGPATALAALAFTTLLLYAFNHAGWRGLQQKTVIVLIVVWLACAARWLARAAPPET